MGTRTVVGRITRECEGCGRQVTRKASAFKAHVFCTRACYLASPYHRDATSVSNAIRLPPKVKAPCLHCGKIVERPPSQMSKRTFCSSACRWAAAKAAQGRQINSHGYVKVFIGRGSTGADRSGHIYEHRLVMQERLGRDLLPGENVHHINGLRADNRPENLELWSVSQPPGQRVEDKLNWAREFLKRYEGVPIT